MNNTNSNTNSSNKNTHQHQSQQHHHHNNQYGNEHSLFVGDLPDDCSDDKLQRLFQSKFKSVKRVQIIRHEDGKSRGFGFIRFEDRNEFQAALSQEMRIGTRLLRLDTAHRTSFKGGVRNRYSSINSTGSNSSHQLNHHLYNNNTNSSSNNNNSSNNSSSSSLHHPHHHQQHHHQSQSHNHHHNQSHPQHGQQHLPSPQQQSQNNKTLIPDQGIGGPQSHHQSGPLGSNGRLNNTFHHGGINAMGPTPPTIHHQSPHTHQQLHNPPHNAQMNTNIFNSSQPKNSQQAVGSRSPKQQQQQPILGPAGDDASSHNKQPAAQQTRPNIMSHQPSLPPSQPITQQNLSQVGNPSAGHAASNNATTTATSTSAVTSLSSSADVTSHPASALVPNQLSISSTGQPPIGPDYRGYAQSGMMENPHLIGAADSASMVPQSSVYGHMYPYGPPPHFGYMPPQPNPVIPISAVPPLPPSQVSSSSGAAPQHHPIPTGNAARYGSAPHHGQQHMPDAMNHMSASVQAPPQAPFYYYYPSPFYFDQTGAAAPPNMYHPQTIHPQFFALPNPAYMPNAHTYANQHQSQQTSASQSDATIPLVSQQQPPPQQQSHSQQSTVMEFNSEMKIKFTSSCEGECDMFQSGVIHLPLMANTISYCLFSRHIASQSDDLEPSKTH